VHALLRVSESAGFHFPLLHATIDTNVRQRELMVTKVREAAGGDLSGARIGLLGLTFKAGTDDLRDSPALAVAELLRAEGAELAGYDPALVGAVEVAGVPVADDVYEVAKGASALVLLTEWPQFRTLDWAKVAEMVEHPVVVDTRNHLDPDVLRRAGISWQGVGHAPVG
jgi:UDPglucose 6-dehydrogenase